MTHPDAVRECRERVVLSKLVLWPGCAQNGHRTRDFCSYRCAEAFAARTLAASPMTPQPGARRGK
jgi:hypothetical protein